VAAIPGRDAASPQRDVGPATPGRVVTHGAEPDGARSVLCVLLAPTVRAVWWTLDKK